VVGKVVAAAAIGGVTGWLLENLLFGRRNSNLFGGREVPFLPVYAVGAAAVVAAAPHLRELPAVARAGVYAGGLSLLELAACGADRELGPASWDYGNGGCVDVPHAITWGALGLALDALTTSEPRR
jgi:hypothetical protein